MFEEKLTNQLFDVDAPRKNLKFLFANDREEFLSYYVQELSLQGSLKFLFFENSTLITKTEVWPLNILDCAKNNLVKIPNFFAQRVKKWPIFILFLLKMQKDFNIFHCFK